MAKASKPAQDFVAIKEIRDGIVILKDGSLKAVLMASSVNFALKSSEEQDAIVFQYQNFLNSLDFSCQFFVQSRRLNIEPYLETLRERLKREYNELLRIQITEYIEFVKSFVESSNIVTKSFYIVVPFTPVVVYEKGGLSSMFTSILNPEKARAEMLSDEKFEEYKTQLFQRVDTVAQGLTRSGVRVAPLNTEELIELYYSLFNPGELEKGKAPEVG